MNRRRFLSLSVAGLTAAALSSCSATSEPESKPTSTSAAGDARPGSPELVPSEFYTGLPSATWDAAAAAEASAAAKAAMNAFIDVSGGQEQWWNRYAPLLADSYAEDAFHIDVARITVTRTQEPEIVNEAQNPLTVHALFSTNDGRWEMVLNREGSSLPWLVFGLTRAEDR